MLSEVKDAEACRCRDKPAEATDAVFRLVKREGNAHQCGHADDVLEHNKQHTSTVVEAGVKEVVTKAIEWPSTDAGRPGLASSQRKPGKSAVAERVSYAQRVGRPRKALPVQCPRFEGVPAVTKGLWYFHRCLVVFGMWPEE